MGRLDAEPVGTKLELIQAAGELFGTKGFMGTSIRDIAKKADVNIASVNYHFGSKENLYTETLLYYARGNFGEALATDYECGSDTSADVRSQVEKLVRQRFGVHVCENDKQPEWVPQLFRRCMMRNSVSLQALMKEIFSPDYEALHEFVGRLCPEMNEACREQWIFNLLGIPVFYSHLRIPILMQLGQDNYSREFIENAINFVTDALCAIIEKSRRKVGRGSVKQT